MIPELAMDAESKGREDFTEAAANNGMDSRDAVAQPGREVAIGLREGIRQTGRFEGGNCSLVTRTTRFIDVPSLSGWTGVTWLTFPSVLTYVPMY